MKLSNILLYISENTTVIIVDNNGNELSRYDGRNSIDESFNERYITENGIFVDGDKMYIELCDE